MLMDFFVNGLIQTVVYLISISRNKGSYDKLWAKTMAIFVSWNPP